MLEMTEQQKINKIRDKSNLLSYLGQPLHINGYTDIIAPAGRNRHRMPVKLKLWHRQSRKDYAESADHYAESADRDRHLHPDHPL